MKKWLDKYEDGGKINLNIPEYKSPNFYNYKWSQVAPGEGNFMAGAGAGNKKGGVDLFGITPISKNTRQYWPGMFSGKVNYNVNDRLNISGGAQFEKDKVTPEIGLKYKFKEGGPVEVVKPGDFSPARSVKESQRELMLKEAQKAAESGHDFSHPSTKIKELFGFDFPIYSNTCVSSTCEIEERTGRKGMPKETQSNADFARNYKDYGYRKLAPGEGHPGDVMQYIDSTGKPYHMGILGPDSMYYSDPGVGRNYQAASAYFNDDGTPKDSFDAFEYVGPEFKNLEDLPLKKKGGKVGCGCKAKSSCGCGKKSPKYKHGGITPSALKNTYNKKSNWLDKL